MQQTSETSDIVKRMVDVADELLRLGGPSSVTVRKVAASAGTTTMSVYSRLGGKDGLLQALFGQSHTLWQREAGRARLKASNLSEQVVAMLKALRNIAQVSPHHIDLMVNADFNSEDDAQSQAERNVNAVKDVIERGVRVGEMYGDAEDLAWMVMAMTVGAAKLENLSWCPHDPGGERLGRGIHRLLKGEETRARTPVAL